MFFTKSLLALLAVQVFGAVAQVRTTPKYPPPVAN